MRAYARPAGHRAQGRATEFDRGPDPRVSVCLCEMNIPSLIVNECVLPTRLVSVSLVYVSSLLRFGFVFRNQRPSHKLALSLAHLYIYIYLFIFECLSV